MILVISSKKVYAAQRLLEEAGKQSVDIEILSVDDLAQKKFAIDPTRYEVLYVRDPYSNGGPEYLSQIVNLAKQFRAAGKRVVDAVIADGELGQGKGVDYKKLAAAGVGIPKTKPFSVIASPPNELSVRAKQSIHISSDKIASSRKSLSTYAPRNDIRVEYPLIAKWIYGFKGKGTFLIQSEPDLKKIPAMIPRGELLLQEFIDADYEYKVITVGYKALPVILRFAINKRTYRVDFKRFDVIHTANLEPRTPSRGERLLPRVSTPEFLSEGDSKLQKYPGSRTEPSSGSRLSSDNSGETRPGWKEYEMPQSRGNILYLDTESQLINIAEQSSRALHRELAKVDILQKGNQFYVLEVNRFPGLSTFEKWTKYNAAAQFLRYLTKA